MVNEYRGWGWTSEVAFKEFSDILTVDVPQLTVERMPLTPPLLFDESDDPVTDTPI